MTDRADVDKGSAEIFYKQVKSWKETKGTHPPPAIVSRLASNDGFIHITKLNIRVVKMVTKL